MRLKFLAHAAQQHLQPLVGSDVPRSHVHELVAAAFGFGSWAALRSDGLLADGGYGERLPQSGPALIGRVVQLGYPQASSVRMADCLLEFLGTHRVSAVSWSHLDTVVRGVGRSPQPMLSKVADAENEQTAPSRPFPGGARSDGGISSSQLLLDELANRLLDAETHFRLAKALRCDKPNPYLYEESKRGRKLNAIEQAWADEYLLLVPRHAAYDHHLRQAAEGGVRQAALDYAGAFSRPEYYKMAERLEGEIDLHKMIELAPSADARLRWLRVAAEEGDVSALHDLGSRDDPWALEQLARRGDVDAMRQLAEDALQANDAVTAWALQFFAKRRGKDLTKSTLAAYHSEGQHAGKFYDSDFGGPLHVEGDEGIELPAIGPRESARARALAAEFGRGGGLPRPRPLS